MSVWFKNKNKIPSRVLMPGVSRDQSDYSSTCIWGRHTLINSNYRCRTWFINLTAFKQTLEYFCGWRVLIIVSDLSIKAGSNHWQYKEWMSYPWRHPAVLKLNICGSVPPARSANLKMGVDHRWTPFCCEEVGHFNMRAYEDFWCQPQVAC